jgi:hypothetical protein
MSLVERKQDLFENIARLRRAGRALPGNRDIAAVRVALERELGEVVSRRLAARVLGVSHVALERWIKAGDVPVLCSATGQLGIPVLALLDLYDAVGAERADGFRRYPLAQTMKRRRETARQLRVEDGRVCDVRSGHNRARARNLAYHQAISRRLRKSMVEDARYTLFRWREQGRIHPRYAASWEQVLDRPVTEIRKALVDQSCEGDDLRQNSPFAGMLSEPERRRILSCI